MSKHCPLEIQIVNSVDSQTSPEVSLTICHFHNVYSLHRKKVYTCGKAKYSKSRGARGKVGGASHPTLSWSKLDQASF